MTRIKTSPLTHRKERLLGNEARPRKAHAPDIGAGPEGNACRVHSMIDKSAELLHGGTSIEKLLTLHGGAPHEVPKLARQLELIKKALPVAL